MTIIAEHPGEVTAKYPLRSRDWWNTFLTELDSCAKMRNEVCHAGLFTWKRQAKILSKLFRSNEDKTFAGLIIELIKLNNKD